MLLLLKVINKNSVKFLDILFQLLLSYKYHNKLIDMKIMNFSQISIKSRHNDILPGK